MKLVNKILAKIFCKYIGEDEFQNQYFVSKFTNSIGKNKRIVIFDGIVEASKVPPMFHAWLHYLTDIFPSKTAKKYEWQKQHQPNLTGTLLSYKYNNNNLKEKENIYESWRP